MGHKLHTSRWLKSVRILHTENRSTHLHKLNHIRVIKLLEDGYLLVNTLQRPFGLRGALRGQSCPTRRRSACLNQQRGNHVKGWSIRRSASWWKCAPNLTHIHSIINPAVRSICFKADTYAGTQPASSVVSWTALSWPVESSENERVRADTQWHYWCWVTYAPFYNQHCDTTTPKNGIKK